jgi:hypothetical protein
VIKCWDNFIKEEVSNEEFYSLIEDIKYVFIDLIESGVVYVYIENMIRGVVILNTKFSDFKNVVKSQDSKSFFDKNREIQEHIKNIEIAILRLHDDDILCNIKELSGLNLEMEFYYKKELSKPKEEYPF